MNSPPSILIVDDMVVGRETLGALLRNQSYLLAFASDGPSALAQAITLLPDLILLDVMMPGMDGFEVCQQIRATPELAEVPVILVTALDDRMARIRGLEAGADDFITKPFDLLELQARVRTVTRLDRYRRLLAERTQHQQALQEVVRHSQELGILEQADRMKNQFISNVAHELRTPLTVITLTSDNLDMLYDEIGDQQRRKLIRQIRKQISMLNDLVKNVLDITRLDNYTPPLEFRRVDLGELAHEQAEQQAALAAQKAQTLRVCGCGALSVWGDTSQLRQVLCNLLSNALKYTPAGGLVTCEYRALVVGPGGDASWPASDQLPAGTWAALRMIDTGIGIGGDDLPYIFERFYRVRAQANVPGTGLGLAITRELVLRHHGHIAVASALDHGSVFAIYLPLFDDGVKL